MPQKNKNVLKYNHEEKSVKLPFIIYADSESLLEKIDTCDSNPKKNKMKNKGLRYVEKYTTNIKTFIKWLVYFVSNW